MVNNLQRGQIILVDLGQGQGSEQSCIRPCVVVSNSANNSFSDVLTVIPMTTKEDNYDFHLKVYPTAINKLTDVSYCLPEQIRCVSFNRVINLDLGHLSYLQLRRLSDDIRFQLDL